MSPLIARWRAAAGCAVWAGVLWGSLEGLALVLSRAYPAIQAAHKVPPSALWVAPVVQVVLFLLLAWPMAVLAGSARMRHLGPRHALAAYSAIGALALFAGQGLLHWTAVLMLGGAGAAGVFRALGGTSEPLTIRLVPRIWMPLGLLAVMGAGTTLATRLIEIRREAATPLVVDSAAPDVVVLILDTVRRDRLQRDHDSPLMPILARWMEGGVVFTDAWAPSSWSLPSQASILTGRTPQAHGADWPAFRMADTVATLPEYFRARGYATGAFSSNDSWITPEYLARGFGRFRVYRLIDVWRRTAGGRLVGRGLKVFGWRNDSPSKPMGTTTDEFIDFIADQRERPVFAYLCYMDANRAFYDQQLSHPSWTGRPPMQDGVAAYDRAITRLDTELERLIEALERRGRFQNTIVVVTSDHGESFGEPDGDHDPKGHGTSLYPEQVRVPFMMLAPGRLPAGLRLNHAVSLTDLAGFVASLAGDVHAPFRFRDLLATPDAMAADSAAGQWLFLTLDYSRFSARSVVAGPLQYIWDRTKPTGAEELFDLVADPLARRSITVGHPLLPALRAAVHRADPAAAADRLP